MKNFLQAIEKSLANENWYSALFLALTLPDICGKIEFPDKNSSKRYIEWFEKYMTRYLINVPATDFYALRCAILHEGTDNIMEQEKRKVLEHYIFITKGAHLNSFFDCNIKGENTSFLQLNVERFCKDIGFAVQAWMDENVKNDEINKRMNHLIEIHEPGYSYKGSIQFS